jgi:hypothetical protein
MVLPEAPTLLQANHDNIFFHSGVATVQLCRRAIRSLKQMQKQRRCLPLPSQSSSKTTQIWNYGGKKIVSMTSVPSCITIKVNIGLSLRLVVYIVDGSIQA